MNLDIVKKASEYAVKAHSNVAQMYDTHPYSYHLNIVVALAKEYLYLIKDIDHALILAGAWVHDVIEDTHETYNDVKTILGEEIAEIAFALTNEKGRSRKERANEKYYEGIRNTPGAIFIKLCDRLANVLYARSKNSRMLEIYKQEHNEFLKNLGDLSKYQPMLVEFEGIFQN